MTSTNNDLFCDFTHPQKLTIDLLFKNDRICKYVANFKTPLIHFHVDVTNVWFLAPQTFTINHLIYLTVALTVS